MAKKNAKKQELKEVSRQEINGTVIITFEDGSVKIIPAPITLSKEEAENIFGSSDEDEEDEDDEEEEDDYEDEDDGDEEEDEDDEEEDEVTGEDLAAMDFEALEDLCDDKDLDTDPDDYEEEDIEKLRKAIAKELGIDLPKAKKSKKK